MKTRSIDGPPAAHPTNIRPHSNTHGLARKLCCLTAIAAVVTANIMANDLTPLTATRKDGRTMVKFSEAGTGTWTIPEGVKSVELLVVGGGGGGSGKPGAVNGSGENAGAMGGGGGGGGVCQDANFAVTPGAAITVKVGAGGAGGASAEAGGESAFGTVIAKGGKPGTDAAGGESGAPTTHAGGTEKGGGGGAGQAGAFPWHTNAKGGDGVRCAITGTLTFYGGGGGTMYSGAGGAGGGGAGSTNASIAGSDGTATKGGGGGGGRYAKGGNGGSGTVIVAYMLPGAVPAADTAKAEGVAGQLDRYNITWDSPGGEPNNSMPLGNGDIGINLWVERNGDLVFYVSKTNAWDENARLCKVGRVRVKFDPPLGTTEFQQELKLRDGMIHITSAAPNSNRDIRVWVDANQPMVRVEADSDVDISCRAEAEIWRLRERPFGPDDSHSGNGVGQLDCKPTVLPDVVVDSPAPAVVWYHRNTRSLYEPVLKVENLGKLIGKFPDPLLNHTFGASLRGTGMVKDGAKAVKSGKPSKRHELAVCVLAERTPSADVWLDKLKRLEQDAWRTPFDKARRESAAWWANFWNDSWVVVEEAPGTDVAGISPVTQAYLLQRFIAASAARGGSPVKFNGTIFTVPANAAASPETPDGDPDWRRWGGNYWFQNTRLVYWPMLASGNYDMMLPFFRMYKEALPLSMARAKASYKLDKVAVFPETMYFWGLPNLGDYGMTNPGPEMTSGYIRHHFNNGIELTAMMLEYYNHTRDDAFVRDTLVPLADPLIAFFDLHWTKRDAAGKIIFDQSQALETYQSVTNPMPDLAGLHYVLPCLLALPAQIITRDQRTRWERMLKQLPPLPTADAGGKKVLVPAAEHGSPANFENPELYAVFPFKLCGVGSQDLDIGRATFDKRANRMNKGWCKDSMQAACLGLGEEAGRLLAARARDINKGSLFPAFWGPNFDWIPDQDHGSNILSTLQLMLLQYDTTSSPDYTAKNGGKIYLLPAWPKDWNASFKLHAPQQTTVEGEVRGGKLTLLKVTPKSREADVINMLAKPQ